MAIHPFLGIHTHTGHMAILHATTVIWLWNQAFGFHSWRTGRDIKTVEDMQMETVRKNKQGMLEEKH